jgi:hypothetical protein
MKPQIVPSEGFFILAETDMNRFYGFILGNFLGDTRKLSVSIVSDYRVEERSSIPGRRKDFFFSPLCPDQL